MLEKQHPLEQAAAAREIASHFTDQTSFDFRSAEYPLIEIKSRNELTSKILRGRAALTSLELVIRKPSVEIGGDKATVELEGSALGQLKGEQGKFLDVHTVEVGLEEIDGEWKIVGAVHIRNERG